MRGHGTRMYRVQHQQEDNGQDEVQDALGGSEDAAERERRSTGQGTKEIGNGREERGGGGNRSKGKWQRLEGLNNSNRNSPGIMELFYPKRSCVSYKVSVGLDYHLHIQQIGVTQKEQYIRR